MAEVGCNHATDETDPTNTAARWVSDAFRPGFDARYPAIRAILWYNIDRRIEEQSPDWRIANLDNNVQGTPRAAAGYPGATDDPHIGDGGAPLSQAQLDAFRQAMTQPYFRARLYA